jgi:inner membrane protein involved in colicin E2 resistance
MRRFERMAEEKRKRKDEQKIEFIIKEPNRIEVTSEAKGEHRQIKISS